MSASAGRVLMIPKGTYDPTVTYEKLDLVSYLGGSYVCKQTTTGNLPTNTTYWQNMVDIADMTGASAGAAGIHGLVPAPAAGDQAKFLRGDATWAELDLSAKADQSIIGGSYNASTAYEKGDRFSYNGVRYKVIIESGTVTGVTPPNATYYEECSVDDDISSLNSSIPSRIGLKLLWENSNGWSNNKRWFTSGSIEVDKTGISLFLLKIAYGNCANDLAEFELFMTDLARIFYMSSGYKHIGSGTRKMSLTTTGFNFSTSTQGQYYDVPIELYGVKLF